MTATGISWRMTYLFFLWVQAVWTHHYPQLVEKCNWRFLGKGVQRQGGDRTNKNETSNGSYWLVFRIQIGFLWLNFDLLIKCNIDIAEKHKVNALHPTDPRTCSRHGTVPMSGLRKCPSTHAVHFTILSCLIAELIFVIPLDVSTSFLHGRDSLFREAD